MLAGALLGSQRSRITLLVLILLAAWALYAWSELRPAGIAGDWHGWRQTDTQTIALNLAQPDASILKPQISWGGDGPGYVETEFQLYTWLVSLLLRLFGPVEWAGQLVSLLAICATAVVVFRHLSHKYHPAAACIGFGALLAARLPAHMATVVMPDALALLAYVSAWSFFVRYSRGGNTRDLLVYGIAGVLAMLIKPTTAHLGISSFLLLLFANRARLRDYRVWIAWTAMVAVFALYLLHAHRLYADYGNTFGLLVGEDSKVPHLQHLLNPELYLATARIALMWGIGPVAAVILVIQGLRRRLDAEQLALLAGNVVVVLIALRYMSDAAGVHYYAPILLLTASLVASLANDMLKAGAWRHAALGLMCALLLAQGYRSVMIRQDLARNYTGDVGILPAGGVVAAGKALAPLVNHGDLIVVRSALNAYDPAWQQAVNFHDPRIFYITGTRGWTLGREQQDPQLLSEAASRGARYLVDPLIDGAPGIDAWASSHGELVWSGTGGGRIWKLRPGPPDL